MPISALPDHLNSREEIENAFPDDSQYGDSWFGRIYRRYQKATKTWFAFSFRCPEWWARWRRFPKLLFVRHGEGPLRWESPFGWDTSLQPSVIGNQTFDYTGSAVYLSRCQYWTRWHFAIQWPLMVSFHFYFRAKDVSVPGADHSNTDGKLLFGYWNHFDADLVYWMLTSLYLGRNWK